MKIESKSVRLGQICKVVSGTTPNTNKEEYWNGTLPWITPAEIQENSHIIYTTARSITTEAVEAKSLSLLPKGTVLLSSRAPIGKVAIAGVEMYCNQGFKNLVCSDRIHNEYLYFFLKSKTAYLNSLGRGATFKEISKDIVENILIPLPPVTEQKRMVARLDKVQNLIALQKRQLTKLDELVKSRFIDLFGDPISNSKHFNVESLNQICDVRDGTHDSPGYVLKGYPLITSKNIINGEINLEEVNFITKLDFDNINKRSKVDVGDILLPMIGTIGNPALVEQEPNYAIKNMALIKFLPQSRCNNLYILYLLRSSFLDNIIKNQQRGGTQKFLALKTIRGLQIPIPPIFLQTQFADFVTKIETQKGLLTTRLSRLETLYKSLMQEYFG